MCVTPRLFEELRIAHGDGSFGKRLAALAKTDLLILDDWGLAPLNQAERNDLLEVLDDRVGTRATLITSQLPPCIGMPISTIRPWPMRSWTGSCMRRTRWN
jgi:DNA replication protein DnaC